MLTWNHVYKAVLQVITYVNMESCVQGCIRSVVIAGDRGHNISENGKNLKLILLHICNTALYT
jgi:hypothetical protein